MSRIKIDIIIYSVILLVSVVVFCLMFHSYPNFIYDTLVELKKSNKNIINEGLNIGTFGDMYGGLNAFLSGLAFIGLLITIFLQIYIHNRELKSVENKDRKSHQNRVTYLRNLIDRGNLECQVIIAEIKLYLDINLKTYSASLMVFDFKISSISIDKINHVINQEEMYYSYKNFHEDDKILEVFECFHEMDRVRLRISRKTPDFHDKLLAVRKELENQFENLKKSSESFNEEELSIMNDMILYMFDNLSGFEEFYFENIINNQALHYEFKVLVRDMFVNVVRAKEILDRLKAFLVNQSSLLEERHSWVQETTI